MKTKILVFWLMIVSPLSHGAASDVELLRADRVAKIRELFVAVIHTQLKSAEFSFAAPATGPVRGLQMKDNTAAKVSAAKIADEVASFATMLVSLDEIRTLGPVIKRLDHFANADHTRRAFAVASTFDVVVGSAREIHHEIERAGIRLGVDPRLPELDARIDRLLKLAEQTSAPQSLISALTFERAYVQVSPVLARHSIEHLCNSILSTSGPALANL